MVAVRSPTRSNTKADVVGGRDMAVVDPNTGAVPAKKRRRGDDTKYEQTRKKRHRPRPRTQFRGWVWLVRLG